MKNIRIRAHHLLCMQGFQGYGYSEEFTKNMKEIIDIINSKENYIALKIVNYCDSICEKCPNNKKGICVFEEIVDMDNKVLHELNIKLNTILITKDKSIFKSINTILGKRDKAKEICKQCSWNHVCIWFNKAQQNI